MRRLRPALRLVIWIAIAAVLGYLVEKTPGTQTVELPEGRGSVTVPASLEGWRLTPGEGDVLLAGGTRFGLMRMEIVKVPAKSEEDLRAYILDRHDRLWREKEDYQIRLRGEVRRFGNVPVPKGMAVFFDRPRYLPITLRYVVQDAYYPQRGEYLRVTLLYPEFARRYVELDEYIIAGNLKVTP